MTRRELLRWARRDAEAPTLDPLLDCRRIIVLAQELARREVHGEVPEPEQAAEAS